jgi:opacity protein-like surface antigen
MKYYVLAIALSATCVFGQPQGRVEQRGYIRGDLGPAITEDADADFFPGAGSVTLDLDPGMRFSVAGGALFGDYFALEVETGAIFNEIDSITGFDDVDGYVSQVPFLLNAAFEFKNNSGLTPFIGAGAGGVAIGINLDEAESATVELDGSAGDVVFAWQAFGGLKYEINENFSVGLVYKFFWGDDAEWEVDDTSQDIEFEGTRTHSISAMVSYKF